MNKTVFKIMTIFSLILALAACQTKTKKEGYTVNGTIHGVTEGTLLLKKNYNDPNPAKYEIKEGKFSFTGENLKEPTQLNLSVKDQNVNFGFYVDNGDITFEGKIKEEESHGRKFSRVEVITLSGCIVNDHEKLVRDEFQKAQEQFDMSKDLTEEERIEISEKIRASYDEVNMSFIKNNPNTFYAGLLVSRLSFGEDADGIKKLLDLLDPKLNTSHVRQMKETMNNMAKTDVKPSEIINATNVTYKVEKNFNGTSHLGITYMGMLSNNNICTLTRDGSIKIVDAQGKEVKSFKPTLAHAPTTMAVDKTDNVYVLYPLKKEVTKKHRGKTKKVMEVSGFECVIFNTKGEQLKTLQLDGVKSATGARVADNKLLVADMQSRVIGVFNAQTGAKETALEGMRPCCGILDFSMNAKNEVLVANLGAFRVQSYDLSGKNHIAFGKRGKTADDFHGCCNPVSVAYLSNGAIVTVEKDPTRVKIYSKDGTKQIEGIQELVKGCSYIPMIVDSNDNLYLASPAKGMVKCVAI